MQNFQSILNEALKADACELILESGNDIQLIKQNNIQPLTKHGKIAEAWLRELAKTVLAETYEDLLVDNPQRASFSVEDFGNVYVIARVKEGLLLRFFLPPRGQERSEQYWETLTAGSDANSTASHRIQIESFENKADDISLESTTPEIELGGEIAPISMDSIELDSPSEPQLQLDDVVQDKPEEILETKEIPFDISSALLVENLDSAPSTAPLPPLPPPIPGGIPEGIPELEKIEDPALILNAVSAVEENTVELEKSSPVKENVMELGIESDGLFKGDGLFTSEIASSGGSNADAISFLLKEMNSLKASHLHLSSGQVSFFRIQDQLTPKGKERLSDERIHSLLEPVIPANQKSEWKERGEIDFVFNNNSRKYRVHVFRDLNGMNAVIRSISADIPSFQQLGLPQRVNELCEFKHGLVILAGPSDNLIHSALASLTAHIGDFLPGRIVSLESQILFQQKPKVSVTSQQEVGLHISSFASGLKSALQENPDVITLSHLVDKKSAKLALKASADILVFAGLTAQSLADARSILDSLMSDSPKLVIDAVLREIIFVRLDAQGKPLYELLAGPSAASKAS